MEVTVLIFVARSNAFSILNIDPFDQRRDYNLLSLNVENLQNLNQAKFKDGCKRSRWGGAGVEIPKLERTTMIEMIT